MPALLPQLIAALDRLDMPEVRRISALVDAEDEASHDRLRNPAALAVSAAWYAETGTAVFPLQPGLKTPMPGSRGFKGASTDVEQVRMWWRRHPGANLGLPCGRRFDVVDVDGPPGYRSFAEMRESGKDFGTELGRVKTPRGLHVYIEPTGIGNEKTGRDHIDYRGRGGYVVAPPSVLSDGRTYRWLTDPTWLA